MLTPIIPRTLAVVAGVGILAAAAHAVIAATGGFREPHAMMVIAATVAVVAGSVAMAHATWTWALALALGLMFGEAYAVLSTADRIVAQREVRYAPARAAAEARQKAEERLAKAEGAKAAADTAALEKAAQRDCAKNCRALLEQAKAETATELSAARSALGSLPAAPVAVPLAHRLRIDAATLDLIVAVLGSLAANGLGAVLIAFGAHGRRQERAAAVQPVLDEPSPEIDGETGATDLSRSTPPSPRDTAQSSFPVQAPAAAADYEPDNDPPKPRGRKVKRKANVIAFPKSHPVMQVLADKGGSVASNRDLARLMGVTEGEASKRVAEVAHLLDVKRIGKRREISLKAVPANAWRIA